MKLLVHQTPNCDSARDHAEHLWKESNAIRAGASTFVVVDRSTSREIFRVPNN